MTITYYVALPFIRTEDGSLAAGEAQDRQTADAAVKAARSMSRIHPGAVAFSRTGDPATGVFAEAEVLRAFGEVPSMAELMADA